MILAPATPAGRTITFYIIPVAIHEMENGHSGTSIASTGPSKILTCVD